MLDHMMALLEAEPRLRFTYGAAEQDFLTWWAVHEAVMIA